MTKNSTLVYSTNPDKKSCPKCGELQCKCQELSASETRSGPLKIFLDRKGRRGKSVTIVSGFSSKSDDVQGISRELKAKLGTGGTVKGEIIEIQGDHRKRVNAHLEKLGYKSKII